MHVTTPEQALRAGRHAEAAGNFDHAQQLYRHVVDHFQAAPEANRAREGIYRIAERRRLAARQARLAEPARATAQPASAAIRSPAASASMQFQPIGASDVPRALSQSNTAGIAGYRLGRLLALLVAVFGWVLTTAGVIAVSGVLAGLPPFLSADGQGVPFAFAVGCVALVAGVIMVLAGHAARSVFAAAVEVRSMLATGHVQRSPH